MTRPVGTASAGIRSRKSRAGSASVVRRSTVISARRPVAPEAGRLECRRTRSQLSATGDGRSDRAGRPGLSPGHRRKQGRHIGARTVLIRRQAPHCPAVEPNERPVRLSHAVALIELQFEDSSRRRCRPTQLREQRQLNNAARRFAPGLPFPVRAYPRFACGTQLETLPAHPKRPGNRAGPHSRSTTAFAVRMAPTGRVLRATKAMTVARAPELPSKASARSSRTDATYALRRIYPAWRPPCSRRISRHVIRRGA